MKEVLHFDFFSAAGFSSLSVAFFLLHSTFSMAQIETRIDTSHIKIGEPIQYSLSVRLKPGQEIQLPELQDTLSTHVEILAQKTDTITDKDNRFLQKQLTLTSYDPGEFLIRSLPVVIDSDTLLSHSFQIQVDDVIIDTANLTGFPIKPIMEVKYNWKDYWYLYKHYILIFAAGLLILLAVYWLYRRKKILLEKEKNVYKSPYEEAKSALKNLDKKDYLAQGKISPFYSDLSLILRKYLGRIYQFSSLELLSDDLMDYLAANNHLTPTQHDRLKQFLFESDLAKFAKGEPTPEQNQANRKWVENFIEETKPSETESDENQSVNPQKPNGND
ncbi:MAG: hypothetical protein WDA08_11590 [Weeksellaceae bacterium]